MASLTCFPLEKFPLPPTSSLHLFPHHKIIISSHHVLVYRGSVIFKNLTFDSPVVTATYATFGETCLVVVLPKSAHIYYPSGRVYVVSMPFSVKSAHAVDSGVLLERDQTVSFYGTQYPSQMSSSTLLILVGPVGEFRVVTTSSTSVIQRNERLVYFPRQGTLCATLQDTNVVVYHVRAATRPKRKRKQFMEEEEYPSLSIPSVHLNMEKKRTSTLLSDISVARVSEPGLDKKEYSLKKEMILQRVDTHRVGSTDVKVRGLVYEDQEAVVVVARGMCRVYLYGNVTSASQASYTVRCLDCEPLNHSRFAGLLVVLQEGSVHLVNPFLDVVSPKFEVQADRIVGTSEDTVMLGNKDTVQPLLIAMEPRNDFVRRCLGCFAYLSGSKINETVWMMWRAALTVGDEWTAFVMVVLSLYQKIEKKEEEREHGHGSLSSLFSLSSSLSVLPIDYSLNDLIPYITLSLHLLREDLRLNNMAQQQLDQMGTLLAQLTTWMGWPEAWTSYYNCNVEDKRTMVLSTVVLEHPPNLLGSLASLFGGPINHYVTFAQLVEETDSVDLAITPRTHHVLKLYEALVSPNYGPSAVVDLMVEYGITRSELATYPAGVRYPLEETLWACQERPGFEWTPKALELVNRRDLGMFLGERRAKNREELKQPEYIDTVVSSVCQGGGSIQPWDGEAEADRLNITQLIFDVDRRYYEITTLLHQTRIQTATMAVPEDTSEYDMVVMQRELAQVVALRTLTIPIGRSALFYSSHRPLVTEKFPIPKLGLTTLILPMRSQIVLSESSLDSGLHEWGCFHNGVAVGLSIEREASGISGSWIIFNRPPELNAQHAGFLMGLGLNGHLRRLEEWHIYNYLGPKHPLTSVGLLIGMAASARGSMDNKLTKVLSVHAVALLPQGANDLNVPVLVQSAGLVGIGLLYMETQHRRMSEILLSQLTSDQVHEGYRLSAGLALGLVNLGKGDDLRGLHDTPLVDKLLGLAVSMKDYQPVQELDKACCGAILALGFIYMRTGNGAIAAKLEVPPQEQLLDYVRPDFLFLRCVAKNLVLWDLVGNDEAWVESQIPQAAARFQNVLDSDQLAFFNILGGTCMSLAVKHASSHNPTAKRTLIKYLDMLMEVSSQNAANYDQRIARHSAINVQNLLALSLAVVMAGSGDLDTLRRLRILHHNTTDMGYGNYMAINLALGFLFLSGGQYAFASSNLAIACLVTAMYPISPNPDHEVHLQALRHLWALSVEPRCLVVRDVDSGKPCKIPVRVEMKDGSYREGCAPFLLPSLESIKRVEALSKEYFRVSLDVEKYMGVFRKGLTLYVQRGGGIGWS